MTIFNDSEALQAEYRILGEKYEPTEFDKHYQHVLRQIEQDPNKKDTILSITRLMVSPEEEYIVYDHQWEGKNVMGSALKAAQTNVGVYPHFDALYEKFINEDNTYSQRLISKNTNVAYFIPFTKDKAEELHKLCNDKIARPNLRTKYFVTPDGGTTISINNYEDWLNGEFNDLYEHGKITTTPILPATTSKKNHP